MNYGQRTYLENVIPFRDTGATLVQYEIQTETEDTPGDFNITSSVPYLKKLGPNASSFGKNGLLQGSYDLLDALLTTLNQSAPTVKWSAIRIKGT